MLYVISFLLGSIIALLFLIYRKLRDVETCFWNLRFLLIDSFHCKFGDGGDHND